MSILTERLRNRPITLIPKDLPVTVENIRRYASAGPVAVCDCYIEGIEGAPQIVGGFQTADGIINIDHHADDVRMARPVSSTNLAMAWAELNPPLPPEVPILINHIDCDSVLSSLIMGGILDPEERFGRAAIAADHTGEENEIANLLQSLQPRGDLAFSVRNLELLLSHQELEPEALRAVAKRQAGRETLAQLIATNQVRQVGTVSYLVTETSLDAGTLTALLPQAELIVLASPRAGQDTAWNVSIRLGLAAYGKFTIHQLDIPSFDPAYGGRWNAGSNKRTGGTRLNPDEYARQLNAHIQTVP